MNNLKIDNKSFKKIDKFLNQYNKSKNNLLNKVTIRNFIKEFFSSLCRINHFFWINNFIVIFFTYKFRF